MASLLFICRHSNTTLEEIFHFIGDQDRFFTCQKTLYSWSSQLKFSFLTKRVVPTMRNIPSESVWDPKGRFPGVCWPGCAMIWAGSVCMVYDYFPDFKKPIKPQLGTLCWVIDKQPHFHCEQNYHSELYVIFFFSGRPPWKYLMILTQRLNCKLTWNVTRHNWIQGGFWGWRPAGH